MADTDNPAPADQQSAWPEDPPGLPPMSPARRGPFGSIKAGARMTYVWASFILVQPGMYILSIVPAILVAGVVMGVYMVSGGVDPATITPEALPPDLELLLIAVASIVQFPVWALMVIAWIKGFERRSLASAGFRGPNPLRRYGLGFALGVAAVVFLGIFGSFVETPAEVVIEDPNLGRLLSPAWILVFVCAVTFFLIQGSCEEIAFRGWMMSSIAARRGLAMGVVLNTILFGSFHFHVFASGIAGGFASILAITCVGLFMSLWAVYDRSIIGVCGAHGAFNASAVVIGLLGGAAQSPEAGPLEVLMQTIEEATALDGEASVATGLVQLAVFAAFSGVTLWLILRRPPVVEEGEEAKVF
ncbi:MAG: type II CAAX endopeptidase family protein [Maricaulaceae bacterium]